MIECAHIRFSTVALFSILHKAIAALLASHQVLHVGHIVETHAPSLLEVVVKVPFAAATENSWEWMPKQKNKTKKKKRKITHGQIITFFALLW